ncbi:MAG: K(+)-transporting ATPase subunit F [bacterium]|nr:K(+)-transporting ATPase subunit F [bacterium]
MTGFHVLAAIGGILLTVYLVVALIYPERF